MYRYSAVHDKSKFTSMASMGGTLGLLQSYLPGVMGTWVTPYPLMISTPLKSVPYACTTS